MGRPRSSRKARWTSRKYSAGFVEDYRGGGIAYVRIGDWRKSLSPIRFVAANRGRAVAILERMIELRAQTVPPSRVRVSADGEVEVLRPEVAASVRGSLFRHLRAYRMRREAEGVSDSWRTVYECAISALVGDQDIPLDAQAIRAVMSERIARSTLSAKSLEVYMGILRRAFRDAADSRLLEFNPMIGFTVKVPERAIELFSPEEEAQIFRAIDEPRRLDYFRLLRLSAMRRAEAAGLKTDDLVEIPGGMCALRIFGKGGRTRLLPIGGAQGKQGPTADWSRELERLVLELVGNPADSTTGRLFDWTSPDAATAYMSRVRVAISHDVPDGRGPHTLRKGALNDWIRWGVPDEVITAWAGNTRRIREKHYYTPTSPADAAETLSRVLSGDPSR